MHREFGFPPIRLVKIDVEGYEPQVFTGAHDWLKESPPEVIVFEWNQQGPGEPDPVPSLLSKYDYVFFTISQTLLNLEIVPYQPGKQRPGRGHDFLAVRKACADEIVAKISKKAWRLSV
jgi:Methyltransferase FkbM domain